MNETNLKRSRASPLSNLPLMWCMAAALTWECLVFVKYCRFIKIKIDINVSNGILYIGDIVPAVCTSLNIQWFPK